jgi:hypothetical protein
MSEAAVESVGAATDSVRLAFKLHRQAMEAWHEAIKTGNPEVTEITKATFDRTERGITETL